MAAHHHRDSGDQESARWRDAIMRMSRKPKILADAAHLIFQKPAKSFTGGFLIDDTFLAGEGTSDFDTYRVDPEPATGTRLLRTGQCQAPPRREFGGQGVSASQHLTPLPQGSRPATLHRRLCKGRSSRVTADRMVARDDCANPHRRKVPSMFCCESSRLSPIPANKSRHLKGPFPLGGPFFVSLACHGPGGRPALIILPKWNHALRVRRSSGCSKFW